MLGQREITKQLGRNYCKLPGKSGVRESVWAFDPFEQYLFRKLQLLQPATSAELQLKL